MQIDECAKLVGLAIESLEQWKGILLMVQAHVGAGDAVILDEAYLNLDESIANLKLLNLLEE